MTERERELEAILAQVSIPIRGIRFEQIIGSLFGVRVERFDMSDEQNRKALSMISQAVQGACNAVCAKPIIRKRPNEVGNDLEPFVIAALMAAGLKASAPKTRSGKGKSAGYPDVSIDAGQMPIFLEVKSYGKGKRGSSLRSFYLSPSDDAKVWQDGHHLLVGFEMTRNGDEFTPVAFEIVDLYGLDCDMKAEFNSDNKRLYEAQRVLARKRV